MSTYHVTLARDLSLADAESAILGEEAGGSEFKGSQLTIVNNQVINLLDFVELDEGRPKALSLLKASTASPAGKTKIWEGTMVINSTINQYRAYR